MDAGPTPTEKSPPPVPHMDCQSHHRLRVNRRDLWPSCLRRGAWQRRRRRRHAPRSYAAASGRTERPTTESASAPRHGGCPVRTANVTEQISRFGGGPHQGLIVFAPGARVSAAAAAAAAGAATATVRLTVSHGRASPPTARVPGTTVTAAEEERSAPQPCRPTTEATTNKACAVEDMPHQLHADRHAHPVRAWARDAAELGCVGQAHAVPAGGGGACRWWQAHQTQRKEKQHVSPPTLA